MFDDEYGFNFAESRFPTDFQRKSFGKPRTFSVAECSLEHNMVKPHDRLVLLGSQVNPVYTYSLSTW